jgi:hypothetical protein
LSPTIFSPEDWPGLESTTDQLPTVSVTTKYRASAASAVVANAPSKSAIAKRFIVALPCLPHHEDGQFENSTADDGNQLKSQRPIYALRDTASPSLCIKLDPLLRELA